VEYKYILNKLKHKYELVGFKEANNRSVNGDTLFATIRHDVDLDLSLALSMAKIEESLNINSTYLVLVSSDAYNIFSKKNKGILNEISSMGHTIGLHYNPLCYSNLIVLESLEFEISILEGLLNREINIISWHRHADILETENFRTKYLDSTKPPFFNAQMKYFADSRGRWRYGHPLESGEFEDGHPLHLCFHPIWWSDQSFTPSERINKYICNLNSINKEFIIKDIAPEDAGKV
jgi:hypothetical protein